MLLITVFIVAYLAGDKETDCMPAAKLMKLEKTECSTTSELSREERSAL